MLIFYSSLVTFLEPELRICYYFLVYREKGAVFNQEDAMKLLQSWGESLSLLRPENLRPFGMVTAKTVLDLYKGMNRPLTSKGNWLLAIGVILLIGFTNLIKMFHLYWLEALLLNSMRYFLFFMFALALRPSVALKSWEYYHGYLKQFWYVMILTIVLGLLQVYLIPLFFIGYMFFLLFFLDTDGSFRAAPMAVRNGFLMLLYNIPICVVVYAALGVINVLLFYLIAFALGYFGGLTIAAFLYVLFVPIEVAIITNLYIKFMHSQSFLYFKQPE